jgi:hypothetical protein
MNTSEQWFPLVGHWMAHTKAMFISKYLLLIQIKVTVHYTAITSKIVDPSENVLRLHTSSGTESNQRFSRQILPFHNGN